MPHKKRDRLIDHPEDVAKLPIGIKAIICLDGLSSRLKRLLDADSDRAATEVSLAEFALVTQILQDNDDRKEPAPKLSAIEVAQEFLDGDGLPKDLVDWDELNKRQLVGYLATQVGVPGIAVMDGQPMADEDAFIDGMFIEVCRNEPERPDVDMTGI